MSDLNSSTALPTEQPSAQAATLSELEQVENLLNGKTPETAPEPAPGGDAEAVDSEVDAEQEAETLDPAAPVVDYTQEIPLSNGQKMTLGELKDFYQGHDRVLMELVERENKVMTQYAELQEMAQFVQLPPEMKQQIAAKQAAYLQDQHAAMLNAIPEFKEATAFQKGRAAIFELGTEYGVDLSQVADHRVVKMLHDFSRLKAAIKSAKANVKPIKTPEPRAKVPAPTTRATELSTAISTAKNTGNQADQLKAVEMLLKG